jgi:hypothetical protein
MMANWRRVLGQKLRHISPEQAKAIIEGKSIGIGSADIKSLTGGYSSQSIDMHVMRRLGIKAGLIKGCK